MDRSGRDLRHLLNIVHDLTARGGGLKVLTGQGAAVDTTTAQGELVSERTKVCLTTQAHKTHQEMRA